MNTNRPQLAALSEDEELLNSIAEIVNRRLDRASILDTMGAAITGLEGGLEGVRPRRPTASSGGGLELRARSATTNERSALDKGDYSRIANSELEAIVLLAGRPVFFVRQDRVVIPQDADISGLMLNRVNAALPQVEPWLPSIGRLDVLNALNFTHIGTAWMVQGNIAVTNRHVAEAFVGHGSRGIELLQNEDGQDYETGIDFVREDGFKGKPAPLRIRRVLHVEPSGGPDIALVELASEQPLPRPIELDTGKLADKHNIMNIGYPAYDDRNDEVEMQRIYGGVYGVKRCAPGQTRASKDNNPFTLEHDATTLGDCSGSVLLSMDTGRAVGLHFSGAYRRTNVAIRATAVLDALARLAPKVVVGNESAPSMKSDSPERVDVTYANNPTTPQKGTTALARQKEQESLGKSKQDLVSSQQVQQYLHELQQAGATDRDFTRQQFLEAACLRDTFSVPQLREAAGLPREADWVQLAIDAEPVTPGWRSGGTVQAARWRLRPGARVAALQALQQDDRLSDMLAHLPSPETFRDPMLRRMLSGKFSIDGMDIEQTAHAYEVLKWLEGSEFAKPSVQQAVAKRLDRLQLFKPFQRLLADGFQGRQRELSELRSYARIESHKNHPGDVLVSALTAWDENPPLVLFGPGGIGKSTMLARFLMKYSGPECDHPLPFVYIDIDRLGFDATEPGRLVVEALRQLCRQATRSSRGLEQALTHLRSLATDSASTDAGAVNVSWLEWVQRFAETLGQVPEFVGRRVLFVIDTFEEIQRRGTTDEQAVWMLLRELQAKVSGLRIIVSGRARPKAVQVRALPIAGLERKASEDLIDAYLTEHDLPALNPADRTRILDIANDNPLSLRLALRLLRQHGAKALADIGTRQWLLFRMSDERVQAQLHARVLSHIDDREIRALAYPGLAVRRITPEVITQVLAGPCGLAVRDAAHAQQLFDKLALEVGLVEPAPDGSLLHRSDVRSVMLESLIEEAGEATIRKIDTAAVAFYETQDSAEARAEEIYHRLRLGQSAAQLDARWRDDAAALLANAIDELPASGRLYLASRLNLSVSDELRRSADQATWERLTARTARNALNRGDMSAAKASLGERREFLPGSALWEIQAEVLRAGGEFEAAVSVVEHATALGGFTAQQTATLQLVALFASERLPRYEAAVDWHAALQSLAEFHDDELLKLRIDTAGDRLRRKLSATTVESLAAETLAALRRKLGLPEKLDRPFAPAELPPALRRRNGQINLNVLRQLKSRPSLLRELVAEYGLLQPEILYFGLEQQGLPGLGNTDWLRLIARELDDANAWGSDQELRVDLATKLRMQPATQTASSQSPNALSSAVGAELLVSLINWLRHDADARELRELIVRGFRDDVDLALGNATLFRTVSVTSVPMR